jgi:hypothetical protein
MVEPSNLFTEALPVILMQSKIYTSGEGKKTWKRWYSVA